MTPRGSGTLIQSWSWTRSAFLPWRVWREFGYLIVIYHMDKAPGYRKKVHPMGDKSIPKRGVLSTRSPCRPSPLGITVVEVLEVRGNRIKVTGLDALNKSPILDIKPYEEHFDSPLGLQWERSPDYRPKDALTS